MILLPLLFSRTLLVRAHLLAAQLGPGRVGPLPGGGPVQGRAELEKPAGLEQFVQAPASLLCLQALRDTHFHPRP